MDRSRRRVLRLSAVGAAGLAGCASRRSIPDPNDQPNDRPSDAPNGESPGESSGDASGATEPSAPAEHPLPEPEDHCTRDATIDSGDPLAVPFDAREGFKCTGEPFDTFESLDQWTAQVGSLAADEEHAFSGTQSARIEASPSNDRARIYRSFPGGLDLSEHHLSLAVKLEEPATQRIVVRLDAPDHRNVLLMGDRVWGAGWVRLDLGPWQELGAPDLTNVTEISVQLYTGGGTSVRCNVDSLRRHPRPEAGRVVLTFNNSLGSHYEQAFDVTEAHGVSGVVSVIPGSTEWEHRIPTWGLQEMQDAGWDVVSSPRSGGGFRNLGPEAQASRIREGKQWLVDNGFERGADVFVWPAGRYDRSSLRVASRYHQFGFAGGSSPTGSLTEPLVVGRVNGSDRERVERLLDLAAKYDQTLPIAYNAVGNMISGIARESFEETLGYAEDLGLEVVTATDVLADLRERVDTTPTPDE